MAGIDKDAIEIDGVRYDPIPSRNLSYTSKHEPFKRLPQVLAGDDNYDEVVVEAPRPYSEKKEIPEDASIDSQQVLTPKRPEENEIGDDEFLYVARILLDDVIEADIQQAPKLSREQAEKFQKGDKSLAEMDLKYVLDMDVMYVDREELAQFKERIENEYEDIIVEGDEALVDGGESGVGGF